MLRMVLLGLLIPLGVGVLSAMELGTPSRSVAATTQPAVEAAVSVAPGKADRLDVAAVSSELPAPPAVVEERIPAQQAIVAPPAPAKPISRPRHELKPKKVAVAAIPKSKPRTPDIKAAEIKRAAISRPSRAASETGPCRLKAFGGLLKALGSADCEI